MNEEAVALWGLSRQKQNKQNKVLVTEPTTEGFFPSSFLLH